jgi:Leucine-rich repeat (LRR) protein
LTALTTLLLKYNQIKDLSPLQHLTALTTLDLDENQIQEITLDFLNNFPRLEDLRLAGNPIKNLPEEIFNHEDENVLTPVRHYLEDLERP